MRIIGMDVAVSFAEENMEVSSRYHEVRLKEAWGYRLNPGHGITIGSTYLVLGVRVDGMVKKVYPDIEYPHCFAELLSRMKTLWIDEAVEILLIHHVSLLSTEDYVRFIGDTEILIKKKLPHYIRDPKVQSLLNCLFFRLSNLHRYDRHHWLITVGKHKFLLACHEYSEKARDSKTPILDAEDRLRYNVKRGIVASRTTGGLAAAMKSGPLLDFLADHKKFALNQISLQRDVVYHLFEIVEEIKECFPYSREEVAEAVRANLPMPAVVIQDELFKVVRFNSEMKMTTYRSVSLYSLRCGVTLSTDRVLIFRRPP